MKTKDGTFYRCPRGCFSIEPSFRCEHDAGDTPVLRVADDPIDVLYEIRRARERGHAERHERFQAQDMAFTLLRQVRARLNKYGRYGPPNTHYVEGPLPPDLRYW